MTCSGRKKADRVRVGEGFWPFRGPCQNLRGSHYAALRRRWHSKRLSARQHAGDCHGSGNQQSTHAGGKPVQIAYVILCSSHSHYGRTAMGIGWPVMSVRLMVMGIHWSMERGVRKQNANRAAPACSVPLRNMSMNCIARTAATQSVMPISGASTSGSCRRHGKTPLIPSRSRRDLNAPCTLKAHNRRNHERGLFSWGLSRMLHPKSTCFYVAFKNSRASHRQANNRVLT